MFLPINPSTKKKKKYLYILCRAQLKSHMFLSVYRDSFSFLFLLIMYGGVISIYKNNNEKKNPLLNLILICYIWQTNKRRIKQINKQKNNIIYPDYATECVFMKSLLFLASDTATSLLLVSNIWVPYCKSKKNPHTKNLY